MKNQSLDQSCSNSSFLPQHIENVINDNLLTDNRTKIPFNFDVVSESVYKPAVEFVVNLHNNNNFIRVDIINILIGIIETIIKPIVEKCSKWWS